MVAQILRLGWQKGQTTAIFDEAAACFHSPNAFTYSEQAEQKGGGGAGGGGSGGRPAFPLLFFLHTAWPLTYFFPSAFLATLVGRKEGGESRAFSTGWLHNAATLENIKTFLYIFKRLSKETLKIQHLDFRELVAWKKSFQNRKP